MNSARKTTTENITFAANHIPTQYIFMDSCSPNSRKFGIQIFREQFMCYRHSASTRYQHSRVLIDFESSKFYFRKRFDFWAPFHPEKKITLYLLWRTEKVTFLSLFYNPFTTSDKVEQSYYWLMGYCQRLMSGRAQ